MVQRQRLRQLQANGTTGSLLSWKQNVEEILWLAANQIFGCRVSSYIPPDLKQ